MRAQELAAQLRADCDQIIYLINSDLSNLNEQQLAYSVHINRCNIRQIMQHLMNFNAMLIADIEKAICGMKPDGNHQVYKRHCLSKIALRRAERLRCNRRDFVRNHEYPPSRDENTFLILVNQQNKLKELIALGEQTAINKKVIPFRFFGLLKLSIGEALEYLLICQKSHFRLAMQTMMLL